MSAGLVSLVAGALAIHLAPNTTLASIGLAVLGALGGSLGALLGRVQRADRLTAGTGPLLVLLLVTLVGLTVACSADKATQPELIGTQWTLVSLNSEPLIEDTEIGLYFEEGQLGGIMTCNGYGGGSDSGKYSAETDGTLSAPILAVTLQDCASPKVLMEQEASLEIEPIYFKLYRETGHLRGQIGWNEYKRLYEVIWHDRAAHAGWDLEIVYDGEKSTLHFTRDG